MSALELYEQEIEEMLDKGDLKVKILIKGYASELEDMNRVGKLKQYEDKIKAIESDIRWQEANDKPMVVDMKDANDMVMEAKDVQKQSKQSTEQSKRIVQETLQIGVATHQQLKEQTDVIKQVDRHLDQIESNLKRAEKQVRAYVRRLAMDKVIFSLMMLLILCVIGAVAASFFQTPKFDDEGTIVVAPRDNFGGNDNGRDIE